MESLIELVNRIQGDLDVKLSSYAKLGVWFRMSSFRDYQRRSNLGTIVVVSSMDVAAPEFGNWGNQKKRWLSRITTK